jgi:hypothetical protein
LCPPSIDEFIIVVVGFIFFAHGFVTAIICQFSDVDVTLSGV